jgi:hypothetical protein
MEEPSIVLRYVRWYQKSGAPPSLLAQLLHHWLLWLMFSEKTCKKKKVRKGGGAREPNQKNPSTGTVNKVYGRRTQEVAT